MNEKQMQDMAVSILLDEYTQLDVAQLLKEYDEAEENGEVPNVPDTLDEACNQMIRREFSKKKQKKIFVRISKVLSRVAMITLMLIGLCTVSVLSVKAWREPALRFVLETFDRRSSVSIEGETLQKNKTPEEILSMLEESIPKEYVLMQKDIKDGRYCVKYIGKNKQSIRLYMTTHLADTYFDTESAEGSSIWVNDHEIIFVNKNGYRAMWLDEYHGLMFDLWAVDIGEIAFWNIVYTLTQ